jgi:ABC-2 type transport system ATP-binding protein
MVTLENIRFSFKDREVLKGISLSVSPREIFGLLGPNGSGKTTLFRILATLLRPSSGSAQVAGESLPGRESKVREKIGVVFQSPSLDGKLTVKENILHHGHLYGLTGRVLKERSDAMMERLGIADRGRDRAEKLSGGLKRRVELAKALLHEPSVLILDEPSTGLDPGARLDLWKYLMKLRDESGMTILVTTHLMDEAEHCGRVAILHQGQILSLGKPEELKRKISGDVILVKTSDPEKLSVQVKERFGCKAAVLDHMLQIEHEQGAEFIAKLAGAFPDAIESITCRKPTLEDVFVHETGHRFWEEEEAVHV